MLDISNMNWFEAIVTLLVDGAALCLCVYVLVLEIKFLKLGIEFFQNQKQDREYRQWQARNEWKDSSDEKNG